ncbi:MAG: hypothetical protein KKH94_12420 [Candidatus Omnitrophica bacterium]|nr:hypothetical protein [Candidatus Omnitrophota bacterium]
MTNNSLAIERKSSASTLSDMELFVFPELMYALVLANIMSPCIWQWRNDPWFKNIESMNPYKRILRLKQYIMDHYVFNLDLETWGLTTQERELARFKDYIDINTLEKSNALFGYEGDKYYFDVDIRKHFGLDKYKGNVIPYWKTETIEAMNAFIHKENYRTGAGECVSLATLYAAALFIVARIPLRDIYLMATPLHSQDFIDIKDGILTNNRRLVTKNMWINGTEISAKARRALEKERVTIVAHESGCIHILYLDATIDRKAYQGFVKKLTSFVETSLTPEVLGNFIRYRRDLQKCFQIRWNIHGADYYIEAEHVFSYETHSPYFFTSQNRSLLINDIDAESFHTSPLSRRIIFNDLETYVKHNPVNLHAADDIYRLRKEFESDCMNAAIAIESLIEFCIIKPTVPTEEGKKFTPYKKPLSITLAMERSDIINHLRTIRHDNCVADLAFYAYRDLNETDVEPFLQAAIERNSVSCNGLQSYTIDDTITHIQTFRDESIYPEKGRCAQPDEVWNYRRGDGIEKALLLANVIHSKDPEKVISITILPHTALVEYEDKKISFDSTKGLSKQMWHIAKGNITVQPDKKHIPQEIS